MLNDWDSNNYKFSDKNKNMSEENEIKKKTESKQSSEIVNILEEDVDEEEIWESTWKIFKSTEEKLAELSLKYKIFLNN